MVAQTLSTVGRPPSIHRNHAKAAAHCHVTQPTLSMMVKKLETELGVKIFDRGQPLLILPNWPEMTRVFEDCRG